MSAMSKKQSVPSKCKHQEESNHPTQPIQRRVRRKTSTEKDLDARDRILQLEEEIFKSRKNYNNIPKLITILKEGNIEDEKRVLPAAFALCHVFKVLVSEKRRIAVQNMPENERVIVQWLRNKHKEFVGLLFERLEAPSARSQLAALQLLMEVRKDEDDYGYLKKIVQTIVSLDHAQPARAYVVQEYITQSDNLRYRIFSTLRDIASSAQDDEAPHNLASNILSILSQIGAIPPTANSPRSKLRAQEAWLALLQLDLTDEQRKTVLSIMSRCIAPWFVKPELLMDFLTDSYNVGGSMSLLALSGLFYLMQEKNLDYPQFYPKLYSLLDGTILHSRHRSRFFRLLDTFLSSTHLPAALVASFIKRLSRLTLFAPPAGIIMVIPWIYNLLKKHPTCTFMIHRETYGEDRRVLEEEGMDDPFDEKEADPMHTDAIESSLWEIQMLQSHCHPNVATLAKIISEQFTKHEYNLEDFLDHSYASMLDTELSREIKKAPVVEFEIPKRVFAVRNEDDALKQTLLERLWDFS